MLPLQIGRYTILGEIGHGSMGIAYKATDPELGRTVALKMLLHGERGKLNAAEALPIIAELARGLHHAHTQGVIHRDIKPHNILLEDTGKPRLTDFGLALQLDDEGTRLT